MTFSETLFNMVLGFVAGFLVACIMVNKGYLGDASSAKTTCEEVLPRDQHCILVAVPAPK